MRKTIMVSGGFDPIHIGHVRMILGAAKYGEVLVVLNSDAWLERKKGFVFMPWEERAEIINAIRGVFAVVSTDDTDGSVCAALRQHQPTLFANGGDRGALNTPEVLTCQEMGITLVWGLGGKKIQSSSELTGAISEKEWKENP